MAGDVQTILDREAFVAAGGVKAGVIHAPVTPFGSNGELDLDRFAQVLAFHRSHGAPAFALPLDVGEGPSLREAERMALVEHALAHADGAPVIADVSHSGSDRAAAAAAHAEQAGASAVMLTTPYYYRPPEAQLIEHFETVATATALPVVLRSSPRTHLHHPAVTLGMARELMMRAPNIVGIVDGSKNWISFQGLRRQTLERDPDFALLTDAEYMTSSVPLGGNGVLSPLSGIAPRLIADLHEAVRRQDYNGARDVQHRVGALWVLVNKGSLPANVKASMALLGRDTGPPRLPNLPVEGDRLQQLRDGLVALGILGQEPEGWA